MIVTALSFIVVSRESDVPGSNSHQCMFTITITTLVNAFVLATSGVTRPHLCDGDRLVVDGGQPCERGLQ